MSERRSNEQNPERLIESLNDFHQLRPQGTQEHKKSLDGIQHLRPSPTAPSGDSASTTPQQSGGGAQPDAAQSGPATTGGPDD